MGKARPLVVAALGIAVALLGVSAALAASHRAHRTRSVVASSATTTTTTTTTSTTTTTPPRPPSITLRASRTHIRSPYRVVLSGRATGLSAGTIIRLFKRPYPYYAGKLAAQTPITATGTFTFIVWPDRETIYRAVIGHTTVSATVKIHVGALTIKKIKAIRLGRASVQVVIFHPKDLLWGHRTVHWWFASGRGRFHRAPNTTTFRLSKYVIVIGTKVALPAGRYRWRACFSAPGARALDNPDRPHGCTGRGYQGRGSLPVGYPWPKLIRGAEAYLGTRQGVHGIAVVDTEGRLSGYNLHRDFITGSVVKAMLLVAYLRRLDAMGQHTVDSYSNSILYPMINVSDNNAATQCWSIVGNAGLYSVAAAAGMTEFSVDTNASWGGEWGAALISPADQAKFFFEMDSLIPKEFVGYARYLLSTIAGYESWGIPAVARPKGYTVFFKAGWRPSPDIYLVHQIARLEGHHRTFAVAIMTDGDPDMGYGIDTIQGTASALLSR